jgi:hypothetical protein
MTELENISSPVGCLEVAPNSNRMAEVVREYPEGIFLYFNRLPPENDRLKAILQTAMPKRLAIITNERGFAWPCDLGMELNRKFFAYAIAVDQIKNIVGSHLNVNEQTVERFLPEVVVDEDPREKRYAHIGGFLVPVPMTNELFLGYIRDGEKLFLRQNGIHGIYLGKLVEGLAQFRKSQHPKTPEWIYCEHIDLVMTGFAQVNKVPAGQPRKRKFYVDEGLLTFLKQNRLVDQPLETAVPLRTDLTLRGGCNIKFVNSDRQAVAMISSIDAIGPIYQDLIDFGYKVVEIGETQVAKGGGVKCRSLDLSWRCGPSANWPFNLNLGNPRSNHR